MHASTKPLAASSGNGAAVAEKISFVPTRIDRTGQELLTVEEVAEWLRVPASWVYERTRRRAADRIPGFRLGKYWRFREADVLAWIEKRRDGQRLNA